MAITAISSDSIGASDHSDMLVRDRMDPARNRRTDRPALKIGVAGFGTIGRSVCSALRDGVQGLRLEAICARGRDAALRTATQQGLRCDVVDAASLAQTCDVIVDCAPGAAFDEIVRPALAAGKTVVTVNGAAMLERPDLVDQAGETGGRLILATGALLGFDAVRAAARGTIHSVTLITRKPPKSLEGAPLVEQLGIDLQTLSTARCLFKGSVREAATGFPANVNVAAALALAGIGPDRTTIEVWADPELTRNTHRIDVDADSARFSMSIENVPSDSNAATGLLTALSVVATLERMTQPVVIGT